MIPALALALVLALAADDAAAPAPLPALEPAAQKFWRSPSVSALLDYREAMRGDGAQYAAMQQFLHSDWDAQKYSYGVPHLPGAGNPPDESELARLGAKLPAAKASYFKSVPGWLLVGPKIGLAGLYADASGGARNRIALPRGQFALLEAQALQAGAHEKLAAWDEAHFRVEFPQPLPLVALSASGELNANAVTAVEAPERAAGCDPAESLSFSAAIGDPAARAGIDLMLLQPPAGLAARASVRNVTLDGASGRVFDLDGDHEPDVYLIQYSADPDAGWDPRMEAYLNVGGQWVYGGARLWVHCRN